MPPSLDEGNFSALFGPPPSVMRALARARYMHARRILREFSGRARSRLHTVTLLLSVSSHIPHLRGTFAFFVGRSASWSRSYYCLYSQERLSPEAGNSVSVHRFNTYAKLITLVSAFSNDILQTGYARILFLPQSYGQLWERSKAAMTILSGLLALSR